MEDENIIFSSLPHKLFSKQWWSRLWKEISSETIVLYFEGKEISSDEAIKKLKQNKKMNVRTISRDSNRPKVHLSTKPMVVEKKEKN